MPQTRQKTTAKPPSRIAPPTPPTTPPITDLVLGERLELPDPPLPSTLGLPEDVAEAKAAAITWLDVEVMLRVTLPLVETMVVTIFCVTLLGGVVLEDVVRDSSFDVVDSAFAERPD